MLAQVSDENALQDHLESDSRTVYCGFDPTAPNLHIGNLVPLIALRRFQLAGHSPIALVGGATGLIGDPSGKTEERQLNSPDVVDEWVKRIEAQVSQFIDFTGSFAGRVVNNLDWTATLSAIKLMRDVGKHFSVNAMINRDAVRSRLESESTGISFTEFSYMLLQANDYLELHRRHRCTIQLGGSDQWGNIVSGVDLIRRIEKTQVFAATFPLITTADGRKFGKTAGNAIWLSADRTSPYVFYQFWYNVSDDDAPNYLMMFSFRDTEELADVIHESRSHPEKRIGQRLLAEEMTRLAHGEDGLNAARRMTEALFTGDVAILSKNDLQELTRDGIESAVIGETLPLAEALVNVGLAESNSRARQLIKSGAIRTHRGLVEDVFHSVTRDEALYGRYHLIRRGRRHWGMLIHHET